MIHFARSIDHFELEYLLSLLPVHMIQQQSKYIRSINKYVPIYTYPGKHELSKKRFRQFVPAWNVFSEIRNVRVKCY